MHYGQTESEKLAAEKQVCRQILAEINKFGISQRQAMFLIYLLSSELEDIEAMQTLTTVIREIGGHAFVSSLEPINV
jgi:hypothetical protein